MAQITIDTSICQACAKSCWCNTVSWVPLGWPIDFSSAEFEVTLSYELTTVG